MDFLLHRTPLLYLIQSFWRDEAFSVLLAQRPLSAVFHITFEPPLYYFLLHFWVRIFGSGEIAVRSLSLVGFLLACCVVVFWAEKLFDRHWLSWYLPLFFFLNPMLLYYAFEARAYGWYIFFTVSSLFAYSQERWILFVATTVLGLYTHTYMIFVPVVAAIHYVFFHKKIPYFRSLKRVFNDPMVLSGMAIFTLFTPWIIKMISEIPHLQKSWYFPIDKQLLKSVIGNIFLGYEGTPDFLWPVTAKLSALLVLVYGYAMVTKKHVARNSLFFLLLSVPMITILGISVYKPLFVNRYMIPCTVAGVFLIVFALENIRHELLQKCAAAAAMIAVVYFTGWYTAYNRKPDVRSTVLQINTLMSKQDVLLVDDARTLYEAEYYSTRGSHVYWYNPSRYDFPWYIGDILYSPAQSVDSLPPYPVRAFIMHLDGTYDMTYSSHISSVPAAPATGK